MKLHENFELEEKVLYPQDEFDLILDIQIPVPRDHNNRYKKNTKKTNV